jgi:hypothetical protein
MDRQVLVAEIEKLSRKLRQREGPLALLMLVASDPLAEDDWNIIVSAPGFNRKTRAEGVRQLTALLRKTLNRRVWPTIKRVTVLRTDDPFVTAMTSAFTTEQGIMDIQSCNVYGFEIPRALVFSSKRGAA